MERPVRSFKSFIRATTNANKPLSPPKPGPAEPAFPDDPSSSSFDTTSSRCAGFSLWEHPLTWDKDDSYQSELTHPFTLREYSLLIPEPPEDIAAMQADPALWQQGHGPFQQTPLDPIRERAAITPEIPARNPFRTSFRKGSKDTLPSVSSRYSISTRNESAQEQDSTAISDTPSRPDVPSPLDLKSALSDVAIKDKAFKSLTAGSPNDQEIIWGSQYRRSDSVQLDNASYVDLQGNKLTTFKKASIVLDDSPISPETLKDSERLRALSFAQDYHNALSGPHSDDYVESEQEESSHESPEDQDPTPQPLTWSKIANQLPPADPVPHSQRPQLPSSSSSGKNRNIRKMSSWVSHQLGKDLTTEDKQRLASGTEQTADRRSSEPRTERHMSHKARLENIVQHGKDLVSRKLLRRDSQPKKHMVISLPLPHHSSQHPADPSVSAAPFELAMPVLRLPGGLAIVRQSPISTSRPQTSDSPSSPFSDLSWPESPASSPFRRPFSRRGSWQSSQSQPQTGSSGIFGRKRSSPLAGSPSALRSFSNSTTELGAHVPSIQDEPATYSPPTTRRRSHNIGSPLSAPPTSYGVEQRLDDASESIVNKLNLFEKAKLAHDTWKKHQKDAKNEKLKQSIRLVGPADARDIAGFIKCAVDGRVSGDSGVGEGRLAGR